MAAKLKIEKRGMKFLKNQGSFHKSLVAIGPVVSEEKIFM
jgi:hypothetical protein